MIHRICDRTTFVDLGRRGRRVREGPVTVTYLPDESTPPRVAYSVGRQVGPAVVRNRLKRRLRAIVAELSASTGSLPGGAGAYLVAVRPEAVSLSYAELSGVLSRALHGFSARSSS